MSEAPVKSRWLLLSLAIVVLDQWTKWLVERHVPEHVLQPIVPGWVNLTNVRNTGVAFGMFAAAGHLPTTLLLAGLSLAAFVVVGIYFWKTPAQHRLLLFALALVLGGAVGNLLDRVMSGAVTDFIDVYWRTHHWPSFNVADSAITVGLVIMALESLWPRRAPDPATA